MNFLANPTVWINLVKALNICYGMNCISPEFYVQALVPCVTVLEMRLLCVCVTVWVCVNCSFLFDSVTQWTLCPPGSSIHGIHQAGVSSDSLLQGIFLTQGSNSGLLRCRQILYHLRHQGSLWWGFKAQLCNVELSLLASVHFCLTQDVE